VSALHRELASELTQADRARVADAEVALGSVPATPRERLAAAMRALLSHRRPESTICPSDAARVTGGDSWRDLMPTAREVAGELARDGLVVVRQHGEDVDVATAVGPVRIARGPGWR